MKNHRRPALSLMLPSKLSVRAQSKQCSLAGLTACVVSILLALAKNLLGCRKNPVLVIVNLLCRLDLQSTILFFFSILPQTIECTQVHSQKTEAALKLQMHTPPLHLILCWPKLTPPKNRNGIPSNLQDACTVYCMLFLQSYYVLP